jgi:peptide/nickel transport system substrate-binding protein
MAVDMDRAVDALFVNSVGAQLAVRAYGPIPLELAGADETAWKAVSTGYDPDGAVKLLESNGWKKGSDGIYAKDGQRFSFVIKTPANDNNRMKLGTIIAASLKRIGIEATAQPVEWATFLNDIKTGATQMFIMGGGSTMNGMEMLFHSKLSKGSSHQTFYENAELDALIEKAAVTIDPQERAQILTEASCITVKDCVHLFGYFEYSQIGMNNRVTDFAKNPTCWVGLCNGYRNVGVQ